MLGEIIEGYRAASVVRQIYETLEIQGTTGFAFKLYDSNYDSPEKKRILEVQERQEESSLFYFGKALYIANHCFAIPKYLNRKDLVLS